MDVSHHFDRTMDTLTLAILTSHPVQYPNSVELLQPVQ